MMQGMGESMPRPEVKLQINPKHKIIRGLYDIRDTDEETASLVADQLLDNAMASATS